MGGKGGVCELDVVVVQYVRDTADIAFEFVQKRLLVTNLKRDFVIISA